MCSLKNKDYCWLVFIDRYGRDTDIFRKNFFLRNQNGYTRKKQMKLRGEEASINIISN